MDMNLPLGAPLANSVALSLVLLSCIVLAALIRIIENSSRSSLVPLAKPAHWSCKYTSLWIWLHRLLQCDTSAVHAAHLQHGILVRLGPNEISICDVDAGLKPVYEGRLPKSDWYQIWASYGEEPMFTMKDEGRHSARRRLLARPYQKSGVLGNRAWCAGLRELSEDLRGAVKGLSDCGGDTEVYDLFFAWAVAAVTTFVFGPGGSLNLLGDLAEARKLRRKDGAERSKQAWGTTLSFMPSVCLRWCGVSAQISWIRDVQQRAEEACGSEQAEQDADVWGTNVYSYAKSSMLPVSDDKLDSQDTERTRRQRSHMLASELQDHIIAGIDTSTTTLAICVWLLSRPPGRKWQDRLRKEAQVHRDHIDVAELERLPVLDAIVKESLRLYPPVAGCQPRLTQKPLIINPEGARVTVPPNTIVHAQAWTLHRNAVVFEGAEEWRPERWLDCAPERRKEMNAWFWAFGSGSRRCLGEHLAISSLKVALVAILAEFETKVTPNTRFALGKGNLALPMPDREGNFLRLRADKLV